MRRRFQRGGCECYARVSTLAEEQEESYDTQVSYYTEKISATKGWTMVKVYSDKGITGTSAEKRPGFMEMIGDAKDGKIDIILCKSVSRFSRNYQEAQKYIHLLKSHGVEVRFEKEGLNSSDAQTDMLMGIMMAAAQQESKSISENVRWTYKRLGEQGVRHVGNNHMLGYDEVDGKLKPNESAWIVRTIFERYAAGAPISAILAEITEKGARGLRTGKPLAYKNITVILDNEAYAGDRLIQKNPPTNYLTKKPDPTQPYDSHFVKEDHEPIIPRELWAVARERRKADAAMRQRGVRPKAGTHELYGKVICGCCGMPYSRLTYKNKKLGLFKVWRCVGRGKHECENRIVKEQDILNAVAGRQVREIKINAKTISVKEAMPMDS